MNTKLFFISHIIISIYKMGNCNTNHEYNDTDATKFENKFKHVKKFLPNLKKGFVVKVYDGDTITIISKIHCLDEEHKFVIRLKGIDAPEIKSNNILEKKIAIRSRNWLRHKILGKVIYLHDIGHDKYGRILANIYLSKHNKSLNQHMLDLKYARIYDGGKKNTNWDEYIHIKNRKKT